MLNHDPFANEKVFEKLIVEDFRKGSPLGIARAKAVLKQIMLRRENDDPAVVEGMAELPPLEEVAPELELSAEEWVRAAPPGLELDVPRLPSGNDALGPQRAGHPCDVRLIHFERVVRMAVA